MPHIFLAGASGAIGRRLIPLLLAAGHEVTGTTRSAAKADDLRAMGITPVVIDVFNGDYLEAAVVDAQPDVIIHQLTDLPRDLDPAIMNDAVTRNAKLRNEGTLNLVVAAHAAGVRRLVVQSIAWAYAPGEKPYAEDAPLDTAAEGIRAVSVAGVVALEHWTLNAAPVEGVVLRYGRLYGPGTAYEVPSNPPVVHVDAAAYAALLAIDRGGAGIFNIAEGSGEVVTEKARTQLGWNAGFRLGS